MKLLVNGVRGGDSIRSITSALLQVDLGARINFSLNDQMVRIEGRLSVGDAMRAIERRGFKVASVVDNTVMDTAGRVLDLV